MRFNINSILKNITKNPSTLLVVGLAFGAGYFVAQKMLIPQQASANAAIPQYQSESEVQYPRKFGGMQDDNTYWEYTDSPDYIQPAVMGIEGNNVRPEVMNSYYDTPVSNGNDMYFPDDDITEVENLL